MMRDTVSDMRKHIWPEQSTTDEGITPEIEKRADEKILALKNEMAEEVSKMLHKQRMTDDKLSTITREMEVLLDKAIVGSRKVDIEAREETIRDVLLDIIKQQSSGNSGSIAASDIVEQLRAKFPFQRIIDELLKMEREGIIMLSDHIIQPPTRIKLSDKKRPIARFKGKS
jgi:hypothetical protein